MPSLPTAAVIGAGSSGIAAAKALHERGVPFTCFEASDRGAQRARRQGFALPVAAQAARAQVPA
jgi:cation diffusion facilitator CzcD-associated flavoprotein CzcO